MVVSLVNTAEGLTNTTVPTAGNTGGASGTAIVAIDVTSPDTITASNTRAAHGGIAYKLALTASPGAPTRLHWTAVESGRLVASFYVYVDAASVTAAEDLGVVRATANMGTLNITSTGKLQVLNTAGTAVAGSASTANFPLQQWVHVQIAATKGTTTSNGRLEWAYFLGDSPTAVQTFDSGTTVNTGTADAAKIFAGRSTSRTVANTIYIDSVRAATLASGWLAPFLRQGTGSGTSTAVGSAVGSAPNRGSGSGASTAVGTAVGTTVHRGTATGTSVITGTAAGTRTSSATAAGTSVIAGTASGTRQSSATGTGSSVAAGTAAGTSAHAGTGAGSSSITGSAAGAHTSQGSCSGTSVISGSAIGFAPIIGGKSGSGAGTSVGVGTAAGMRVSRGTAAGSSICAGAAIGTATHRGIAAGLTVGTGSSVGAALRHGLSVGNMTCSGTASGYFPTGGTGAGTTRATGTATGIAGGPTDLHIVVGVSLIRWHGGSSTRRWATTTTGSRWT